MSDYVQQMWASQPHYGYREHSKALRVTAIVVGVLAAFSVAAYATQDYWYSYVSPYLP